MASDASQSAQKNIEPAATPQKSKMGRPAKPDPDKKKLEAFMANYPTAESTCLFFEIGIKKLYRFIKREYGLTYDQFRERHMIATRHALVQKALARAMIKDSDRMLELCLKNLAGWNGLAHAPVDMPVIQLRYSLDTPPPSPPRDVTPKKETA